MPQSVLSVLMAPLTIASHKFTSTPTQTERIPLFQPLSVRNSGDAMVSVNYSGGAQFPNTNSSTVKPTPKTKQRVSTLTKLAKQDIATVLPPLVDALLSDLTTPIPVDNLLIPSPGNIAEQSNDKTLDTENPKNESITPKVEPKILSHYNVTEKAAIATLASSMKILRGLAWKREHFFKQQV